MTSEHTVDRRVVMYGDDQPMIDFCTEGGRARTYLNTRTNTIHIDDIEVADEQRRHGKGKALLRAVRYLADEIDAHVTAQVVSRECLDAMKSVYGEAALDVRIVGGYESDAPAYGEASTSASLLYMPD